MQKGPQRGQASDTSQYWPTISTLNIRHEQNGKYQMLRVGKAIANIVQAVYSMRSLARAFSPKHDFDRLQNDDQIHHKTLILNVI